MFKPLVQYGESIIQPGLKHVQTKDGPTLHANHNGGVVVNEPTTLWSMIILPSSCSEKQVELLWCCHNPRKLWRGKWVGPVPKASLALLLSLATCNLDKVGVVCSFRGRHRHNAYIFRFWSSQPGCPLWILSYVLFSSWRWQQSPWSIQISLFDLVINRYMFQVKVRFKPSLSWLYRYNKPVILEEKSQAIYSKMRGWLTIVSYFTMDLPLCMGLCYSYRLYPRMRRFRRSSGSNSGAASGNTLR